jgi:septal ring factor EnvC (AmiA/AmiB activator)
METQKMKKYLRLMVIPAALVGMGIAMPSCPGQKEMQQQVDTLQNSNMDLSKKVQALTLQVNSLNNDMTQAKQLLSQVTSLLTTQKTAFDQLDVTVKDLETKVNKTKKKAK